MKKVVFLSLVFVIATTLVGCQSKNESSNTDDAEIAPIDQSGSDIAAPPVPPVPTRPAN